MSMVCGLDLHRQQITFDALETESGEVRRGRVWQHDCQRFRRVWDTRHLLRGLPVQASGGVNVREKFGESFGVGSSCPRRRFQASAAEPAARIGWALMGSTISVTVGVSVRVGA
jgi:hypothetical protein